MRRSEIPGPFLKVLCVTNIITIIKLGPDLLITAKIWNNRWVYHTFLSLIVSSWRHGLQMANEADEVLLGKRLVKQATAIKNYGICTGEKKKKKKKNAIWERWVVSTIVLPKSALWKRSRCYWETRSKRQRATCADSNWQSKTKIDENLTFCCGLWQ